MNWSILSSIEQLQELAASKKPFAVLKHSTRCPVSSMAKRSLEFDFDSAPADSTIYYLDLIALREISNYIADHWQIRHESPQILVLKGEACLYNASHQDIELKAFLPFITE